MWYHTVPCLAIMVVSMSVGHYFALGSNYLTRNKKIEGRYWSAANGEDCIMYQRDTMITGSPYIPRGLESIPLPQTK